MATFAARLPDDIRPEIAAMSPLEVIVRAMSLAANAGNWPAAADLAAKAAPYLHPRLANETHRIEHAYGSASAEDLRSELADLRRDQGTDDPARTAGADNPQGSDDLVH